MTTEKTHPPAFEFPPNLGDTSTLPLDKPQLKVPENNSQQEKIDPGFNPYDTGVHRALAFAAKVRRKA